MGQILAHFPTLPNIFRAFNGPRPFLNTLPARTVQKTTTCCPECGQPTRSRTHNGKTYEVCKEAFCPDPVCFWFREQS